MLTLTSAKTYAGPTAVSGGTLRLSSASVNVLPSSTAVTVGVDSVLDINGVDQTVGSLSGQGNVTLGSGLLTVNSSVDSTFSRLDLRHWAAHQNRCRLFVPVRQQHVFGRDCSQCRPVGD